MFRTMPGTAKYTIGDAYKRPWWTSLAAQTVKRLPAMWETWVLSLLSGRSPGEGNDNPLQYSCLENPVDRGAWWATVHRVTKNQTRLSNCHTHSWCKEQMQDGEAET